MLGSALSALKKSDAPQKAESAPKLAPPRPPERPAAPLSPDSVTLERPDPEIDQMERLRRASVKGFAPSQPLEKGGGQVARPDLGEDSGPGQDVSRLGEAVTRLEPGEERGGLGEAVTRLEPGEDRGLGQAVSRLGEERGGLGEAVTRLELGEDRGLGQAVSRLGEDRGGLGQAVARLELGEDRGLGEAVIRLGLGEGEDRPAGGVKTLSQEFAPKEEPSAEEVALEDIDRYFDVYDNPGNPEDPDGVISQDDLNDVANGDYNRDEAREILLGRGVSEDEVDQVLDSIEDSAGVILDSDLYEELDSGNVDGSDDRISRGDVSRVVFDRLEDQDDDGNFEGTRTPASNRDGYDEDGVETMDERTQEVVQEQEAAILNAVESGDPVEFTNANGQTEMVTVVQRENTDGQTVYEITGEDGHTLVVTSELGATDNLTSLGRIVDYYTQLPQGSRPAVDEVALFQNSRDDRAADYRRDGDKVRFYGLDNLNEEVFNHEYGHGVGYEVDGEGESLVSDIGGLFGGQDGEGTPDGWDAAIESDSERLNDYSETNNREDFAESWAAYLEAVDQGPEALAELEERYPARYAILDELYAQLQEG